MQEEMEMVRDEKGASQEAGTSSSAVSASAAAPASSSMPTGFSSMFAISSPIEDQGEDQSGWCDCLIGLCRKVDLEDTNMEKLLLNMKLGYIHVSDQVLGELKEKKTQLGVHFHKSVLNRDRKNPSDCVFKAIHLGDLLPFNEHIRSAFMPPDAQSDATTVIVTQTFVSLMTPFLFGECCSDLGMSKLSVEFSMNHEDIASKMNKLGVDANLLAPGMKVELGNSSSSGKGKGSHRSFVIDVEGEREFPDTKKMDIMKNLYYFQSDVLAPLLERVEALNQCAMALRIGKKEEPKYYPERKVEFSLSLTGYAERSKDLKLNIISAGFKRGSERSDAHEHEYKIEWNHPLAFTKMSDHQYQDAYFVAEISMLKSIDKYKGLVEKLGSMVVYGSNYSDFVGNAIDSFSQWSETLSTNKDATAVMFGPREGGKSSLAVTLQSLIAFVVKSKQFDGSDDAFQKVKMRPLNTKQHKDQGATDADAKDQVCLTLLLGGKHHVQLIDTGGDTEAEFTKKDFHEKYHMSILVEPLELFMEDGKLRTPTEMKQRFGNNASYENVFGEGVTDLVSVLNQTNILALTKPDGAMVFDGKSNDVLNNVSCIAESNAQELKKRVAELQRELREMSGNASLRVVPVTLILTWKHADGVTRPATVNMHAYNQLTKELGTNLILELFQVMGEISQQTQTSLSNT